MSSSYSSLKFELIGTGEQSGIWGSSTNVNIGTAIEQAVVGMATLTSGDFTTNVATLTLTDTNAAQNARAFCLNIAAGAVSAAGTINVPAIQKPYIIINGSSFTVTVKVSGLTGVAVPAGRRTMVYNNGTDVGLMFDYAPALTATNLVFDGDYTEEVFTITDGASVDLDPSNGTVQIWTLGASRTATASSFASGQSMTLMVDDGSAYAITWPSVTWKTDGGSPPTLNTTGFTAIQLWKVSAVLYGARVGDA
jgi:hypothetical protein